MASVNYPSKRPAEDDDASASKRRIAPSDNESTSRARNDGASAAGHASAAVAVSMAADTDTGTSSGASAVVERLPFCWRETVEKDGEAGPTFDTFDSCEWPAGKSVRAMMQSILDPERPLVAGRDVNTAQKQPVMLYRLVLLENGDISLEQERSVRYELPTWTRDSEDALEWLGKAGGRRLPKAVIVFTFPPLQPAPQRARLDPEEGSGPRGMAAASLTRREAT